MCFDGAMPEGNGKGEVDKVANGMFAERLSKFCELVYLQNTNYTGSRDTLFFWLLFSRVAFYIFASLPPFPHSPHSLARHPLKGTSPNALPSRRVTLTNQYHIDTALQE